MQKHLRANGEKMGFDFSELNDDQLTDDYHYLIFPNITLNIHCNSVMIFRQRPHETDPNKMYYDVQNYSLVPEGEPGRSGRSTVSSNTARNRSARCLTRMHRTCRWCRRA